MLFDCKHKILSELNQTNECNIIKSKKIKDKQSQVDSTPKRKEEVERSECKRQRCYKVPTKGC